MNPRDFTLGFLLCGLLSLAGQAWGDGFWQDSQGRSGFTYDGGPGQTFGQVPGGGTRWDYSYEAPPAPAAPRWGQPPC